MLVGLQWEIFPQLCFLFVAALLLAGVFLVGALFVGVPLMGVCLVGASPLPHSPTSYILSPQNKPVVQGMALE